MTPNPSPATTPLRLTLGVWALVAGMAWGQTALPPVQRPPEDVFAPPGATQPPYFSRDYVSLSPQFANRLEAAYLFSGAEASDVDEGIFQWDHVTHVAWMHQLDADNWLRAKHQYWEYLPSGHRNLYEAEWRRRLDRFEYLYFFADYLDDRDQPKQGDLYVGRQGLIKKDWQWYAQVGLGLNDDEDVNTGVFLEVLKPLSPSTMLRASEDLAVYSNGYGSNQTRVNVAQALSQRTAVNLGYRFFANQQADDDEDDLVSHQVSRLFVFQLRENLFASAGYRHYWNNDAIGVNSWELGGQWSPSPRLKLVGGYQFQDYNGGPENHGLRAGVIFQF